MKDKSCIFGNLRPILIIPIHGTAMNKELRPKAAIDGTSAELDTQ
jgi:hypothetical protein